jgi:proteasome assembly chaperone 2
LIQPAPNGIGFLGQLAIDLLIHSFGFHRVGYLESSLIEQIVGSNCFSKEENTLYTAFELYQSPQHQGISILQLRSNCIQGHGVQFAKELNRWIESNRFRNVILLTGLDKTRRNDAQLNSSPLRYYSKDEMIQRKMNSLDVIELEPFENEGLPYVPLLPPGAGLTNFLLAENKLPTLVLSYFTEVGDNNQPAEQLFQTVVSFLSLPKEQVKIPLSWSTLYGPETNMRELF